MVFCILVELKSNTESFPLEIFAHRSPMRASESKLKGDLTLAVTRGPQFSHGIRVTPGGVVVASATKVRRWVKKVTIDIMSSIWMLMTMTTSPSFGDLW